MIKMNFINIAAALLFVSNALLPPHAESSEKLKIPEEAEIKIIEKGVNKTDTSKDICVAFNLSVEEVRQFFKQAEIIQFSKIHDSYNWLPCFVRGTYTKVGKVFEWNINAGGFAAVKSSD